MGWDEEQLQSILDVLEDMYKAQYEIKNCIRGCYTGANDYEHLVAHMKGLGQRLIEAADMTDTHDYEMECEEGE